MNLTDITDLLEGVVPAFTGYADTGAKLPYVVTRPQTLDHQPEETSINGLALAWNNEFYLYACGGSVEASFNLAKLTMSTLQGARVGDSVLDTTMGYVGAQVEGHYESQITVQVHQGGL